MSEITKWQPVAGSGNAESGSQLAGRWWALATLVLAVLAVSLDGRVLSVALAVSAGIAVLGVILVLSLLPGTRPSVPPRRPAPPGTGTGEVAINTRLDDGR